MAIIIVASLVLVVAEVVFCMKRTDPKHEFILGLYQCISGPTVPEGHGSPTSGLKRVA